MMHDICDSPVSLSSQSQLDDWNGVVHGVLSHGTKPGLHLGALLEVNPDFASDSPTASERKDMNISCSWGISMVLNMVLTS